MHIIVSRVSIRIIGTLQTKAREASESDVRQHVQPTPASSYVNPRNSQALASQERSGIQYSHRGASPNASPPKPTAVPPHPSTRRRAHSSPFQPHSRAAPGSHGRTKIPAKMVPLRNPPSGTTWWDLGRKRRERTQRRSRMGRTRCVRESAPACKRALLPVTTGNLPKSPPGRHKQRSFKGPECKQGLFGLTVFFYNWVIHAVAPLRNA